jgi:hypothetical protein
VLFHREVETHHRQTSEFELITVKVGISVYLGIDFLNEIERDVQGKNRSEKLVKCAKAGYRILSNTPKSVTSTTEQAEPKDWE